MSSTSSIYQLDNITDDPRYAGFYTLPSDPVNFFRAIESVPDIRSSVDWEVKRLSPHWPTPSVHGRINTANDYPCVNLVTPAFSPRAIESLGDLLTSNGELLPINTSNGIYYVYNVTTICDALDTQRAIVERLESGAILEVKRFELHPSVILPSVFIFRQLVLSIFVSAEFVRRAKAARLRGMRFTKVWPLPPGVDWQSNLNMQWSQQQQDGLPVGRQLKGNSLVIQLYFSRPNSRPLRRETALIDKIMDALEQLLFLDNIDAAPIGHLEGRDLSEPGECRLFISCPDADVLFEALKPWLESKPWPGPMRVTKRSGHFRDVNAEEREVFLSEGRPKA